MDEDDDSLPFLERYTGNNGPFLLFGGGCAGAFMAPSLAISLAEDIGRIGIIGGVLSMALGASWILRDVREGKKRAGIPLILILFGLPFLGIFIAVQAERTREDLRWKRSNTGPTAAIWALEALHEAQERFRTGDLDKDGVQDYGSLGELDRAGLLPERLGSGVRQHYVFECQPSAAGGSKWFATARPTGDYPGDPFFCTNQEGKIFRRAAQTEKPFRLNTKDCVIPADATERL